LVIALGCSNVDTLEPAGAHEGGSIATSGSGGKVSSGGSDGSGAFGGSAQAGGFGGTVATNTGGAPGKGGTSGDAGGSGGAPVSGGASGSSGVSGAGGNGTPGAFVHPGLLLRRAELERMRTNVAAGVEPYVAGWKRLQMEGRASLEYQPKPFAVVTRNTGAVGAGNTELRDDANAAFFHAVEWAVSGNEAHARKSVAILDAWSGMLTAIEGDADRFLAAGLYGYQLANAGEILRYTYPAWSGEPVARFQRMLVGIFYPLSHEFLTTHAGSRVDHHFASWDTSMLVTVASIGVFADDRSMYGEALDYFLQGPGNGSILHAVFDGETGQLQESGRDQAHAQLGIGMLAALCETAYGQGDDLYGAADNRLLKGFEYMAQYLLGMDVPFKTYSDQSRTFTEISSQNREQRRPIYEMVWNHYGRRRGVPATYTQQLAAAIRPEGYHGDHPGFGTLLFTQP
jgi:hypothetical protein